MLTENRSVAPTVSSSMKLRLERRSSSMLQSAAMRPLLRISTSSQVSSISRSRCEEMSSRMLPSLRISLMSLDHALARDGIEAVGGLIENEQARAVRQRLGQLDQVASCPASRC